MKAKKTLITNKGVPMNPKPLDAGLAKRLYKSVKGPCAYPFKWLYPSEKAFWRVVAAEVRKIVKEAKEGE